MPWLPVALLPPAFSALGNYVDKHMLSSYAAAGGLGAIVMFSCLFAAIVVPVAFFLGEGIFAITSFQGTVLIINGILTVIALVFYLYAIDSENVLLSIPILQIVPVFAFILSYIVLGEVLSVRQVIGSLIVLTGATFFALEIHSWNKVAIKGRSVILVLCASLPLAATGVIFKWAALDIGYWTTQFWEYVGIGVLGASLFVLSSVYRKSFFAVFDSKIHGMRIVGFIFIAEALMVSSDLILNFVTLLAPVALAYVVNSFHPAFVFIYGFTAAVAAPHVMQGVSWSKRHIPQYFFTIAAMIGGAILLYI